MLEPSSVGYRGVRIDPSRIEGEMLPCGYTLAPGARVVRGPRGIRRRRSDYKPVLLQCGIITDVEFDALEGLELLQSGDGLRKAAPAVDRIRETREEPKLSYLLQRFLTLARPNSMHAGDSRRKIHLGHLAKELGAQPRRLCEIATVLESLQVVGQTGILTYEWRGLEHVQSVVDYIRDGGEKDDYPPPGAWMGSNNEDNRERDAFLWTLTRKFLRLLQHQKAVNVSDAAEQVASMSDLTNPSTMKTIAKDLLEIAHILLELRLVVKTKRENRWLYQWAGVTQHKTTSMNKRSASRPSERSHEGMALPSHRRVSNVKSNIHAHETPAQVQEVASNSPGLITVLPDGCQVSLSNEPEVNHRSKYTTSRNQTSVPFTHFPFPFTVLSNASVVQVNQPPPAPAPPPMEPAVRLLNPVFGEQYFNILNVGQDGMEIDGNPAGKVLDSRGGMTAPMSGVAPKKLAVNVGRPGASGTAVLAPVVAYSLNSNGRHHQQISGGLNGVSISQVNQGFDRACHPPPRKTRVVHQRDMDVHSRAMNDPALCVKAVPSGCGVEEDGRRSIPSYASAVSAMVGDAGPHQRIVQSGFRQHMGLGHSGGVSGTGNGALERWSGDNIQNGHSLRGAAFSPADYATLMTLLAKNSHVVGNGNGSEGFGGQDGMGHPNVRNGH